MPEKISLEKNKAIQINHYHRWKKTPNLEIHINNGITCSTLVKFLPPRKCRILDLGCGEANAFKHLKEHDYYALDCCEEALEIAKSKVEFPEKLKLGMIEELPFDENFFDVVWAVHILEHSCDIEMTLNEIVRVLRPGGFLIFALPQGIYDEPAHRYQMNMDGWRKILSEKFNIIQEGVHPFNLNQYYGVCKMSKDKWEEFYHQKVPYKMWINSPMIQGLVQEIASKAKAGDKLLEIGTGTGYTAIELSRLGYEVYAIDLSLSLIEGAEKSNKEFGGSAMFQDGDMFKLNEYLPKKVGNKFKVIFHQGVLEHFKDEQIIEVLKLQLPLCEYLIFSIPCFRYAQQDFGNERLLTLRQWKQILAPLSSEILTATYYGEGSHYILITLKGGLYAVSRGDEKAGKAGARAKSNDRDTNLD